VITLVDKRNHEESNHNATAYRITKDNIQSSLISNC
jgi:hypothetical protein